MSGFDLKGDSGVRRQAETVTELLDLTQELRAITMPASDNTQTMIGRGPKAVLLVRDSDVRKWGSRWLRQSGLEVEAPDKPNETSAMQLAMDASVVVVDASLKTKAGHVFYKQLTMAGAPTPSVFVMCANQRETKEAVDAQPFDIIRKPVAWEMVARRVVRAATLSKMQGQLDQSEDALRKALSFADQARKQLRSRESIEPVTGLPNKMKFKEIMGRGMRASMVTGGKVAVFVIGFTRFRLIVEAMGQSVADELLGKIAEELTDSLRDLDAPDDSGCGLHTAVVSSLDQARFGIMLSWSGAEATLTRFRELLLHRLSAPIAMPAQSLHLSACIGAAVHPADANSVDSLLQRAENAMREAQRRGGGFRFYCAETEEAAARKLQIERMLTEALDHNALRVAYQPIVSVTDNKVLAVEALLRWKREDGTVIHPMEFIPIAEESGLMLRLGEYVLDRACAQLKAWIDEGLNAPCMCVNVAKVQLMHTSFYQTVDSVLQRHGVPAHLIELEISERGVLSGDYDVISQLHELKALGIRLSVDDFGTGESAIAYLKELPVDVLKVDKSYISGIVGDPRDAAITSAMVALGQRLNLTVIAEGVETQDQLAALQGLRCDAYQGYLHSRASHPDEVRKLLAQRENGVLSASA
ncbi:MAG: bifunctional diguanylate cyclase/phosphodiesterase [Pseudomonadota bacterium]